MCGFAGLYSPGSLMGEDFEVVLKKAGQSIRHRGPDDSDVWLDEVAGIGLVHRRLSIQDLSPLGAQPMVSSSGRYIIAFNGEIYNFKTIREGLKKNGSVFRGLSDTETMLASFDAYGIDDSLELFSGMFAFVVYDREKQQLVLARDRLGEKPLYYGWSDGRLVFASELKALRVFPFWEGEINRDSLTLLLRHNYIPAPHSIYKGIYKLPPSTSICFNLSDQHVGILPEPVHYWSLSSQFEQSESVSMTCEQAADKLDGLLREVISEQMISDVPLGAFLSGGVDSSLVVSIMQQISNSPVKTFSIGFDEIKYNEAEYAKAVARHLGTDHTELYVTAKEGLDIIPRLPEMYDEPFADSSQIPTYLVAEMTRRDVTVALSGDGGDELFCGYSQYFDTKKTWSKQNAPTAILANKLLVLASWLSPELLSKLIRLLIPSQRYRTVEELTEKIERRRLLLSISEFNEFYRQIISYWNKPELLVLGAGEPVYAMNDMVPEGVENSLYKKMMWHDLRCYLPDDILVKVDRASMACSLETRIPLLDRRIVEFALGLPIDINVTGGQGKQVLRDVLYRYVPRKLIDREKAGFAAPIGQWLRGELREWAESLLEPSRLLTEGFWNVDIVRNKWEDHIACRDDHAFQLWGILMFQAWYESQKEE